MSINASLRLSQQAMAFVRGKEAEVIHWLEGIGCTVTFANEPHGEWHLVGLTGVTVGLSRCMDPIGATVQIGILLAGLEWTFAFPDALKLSVQSWGAETKRRRKEAEERAR